jgi:hypothetical protein
MEVVMANDDENPGKNKQGTKSGGDHNRRLDEIAAEGRAGIRRMGDATISFRRTVREAHDEVTAKLGERAWPRWLDEEWGMSVSDPDASWASSRHVGGGAVKMRLNDE